MEILLFSTTVSK